LNGYDFLLLVALGAGSVLLWHVARALLQIRRILARLAARDFRPVMLQHPLGLFRRTAAHLRTISELLEKQDQQIADEGFSLRAILSSMVEGVMIVDPGQRIRLVNTALQTMFALRQSPVNRTLMEVFLDAELQEAVTDTLTSGERRAVTLRFHPPGRPSTESKTFEVHSAALNPSSQHAPLGAVVVFHDISRIEQLEAVRKEFVANVSHEFRTPLAIINGYLETLLDGGIDDRHLTRQALGVMEKHGQRLNFLIDDLLTISRLESKAAILAFSDVDLPGLTSRVIESLEATIREKSAEVTVFFPTNFPALEADEMRMEQIVFNLLNNALRYGNDSGAKVSIEGSVENETAILAIRDNGPGIPYADQPHLFERFYRVHKDRSRDAGGTGLGLSIVKNIALAHGGSVDLQSVPGNGSTFVVKIPIRQNR